MAGVGTSNLKAQCKNKNQTVNIALANKQTSMSMGMEQKTEQGSEDGIISLGVPGGWSKPCGCWKPKPDPPQEQQVLLTAEPSLQCPEHNFIMRNPDIDKGIKINNTNSKYNLHSNPNIMG